MPTISNEVVKFGGDNSGLARATRGSIRLIKDLGRATAKIGLVGAAGVAAGAAAVTALGKASAENIDRIQKLGSNIGFVAREVQQLELIADLTGVGIGNMTRGVQRLTREVGKLKIGRASKEVKVAFDELGLSVEQLDKLNPAQLFRQTLIALSKVEDPAKRASLGFIVMGKAFTTMNPLVNDSVKLFRETDRLMTDLGLGLTSNAAGVEGLNDALTILKFIGVALRDQVFAALLPMLRQGVLNTIEWAGGLIKAAGGAEKLAQTIKGAVVENLGDAISVGKDFIGVLKAIADAVKFVSSIVGSVGDIAGALGASAAAVARGEFSGAGRILSDIPDVFRSDEEDKREQKTHTQLLRQIADQAGAAFG